MDVAVYGGSFNPPHIGHAMVAAWLLWTRRVEEVWLVPAFAHAFDKALRPFAARVEMVEATLWYAICYVPVGIAILALSGRLGNFVAVMQWRVAKLRGLPTADPPETTKLKTAPVIAVAGVLALAGDWLHSVIV